MFIHFQVLCDDVAGKMDHILRFSSHLLAVSGAISTRFMSLRPNVRYKQGGTAMWINLTDVNGDHITLNFAHVVSFNPYGTGTHIVTTTAGLTFFVKETTEEIQRKVGITTS